MVDKLKAESLHIYYKHEVNNKNNFNFNKIKTK